jgi:hypothetical protein
MKTEIVAALLVRTLGLGMFLLGALIFAQMGISYFLLRNEVIIGQDTYFVVNSSLQILMLVGGLALLVFSKPLGRLLAKGLQ